MSDLVNTVDALLPQTQCGECGYLGCKPYAKAIVEDNESIDKCPPGGVKTLEAVAKALQIDAGPYREKVVANTRKPSRALINEAECIGCTKCIQACPVDAIIGSNKWMHSVIEHECTGCELCVEPCPVDCIEMVSMEKPIFEPSLARHRFEARNQRLEQKQLDKQQQYQQKKRELKQQNTLDDKKKKQDYILAALKRAQAKK